MDVGVPASECEELSSGVFKRTYTKGTAQMDCNTWQATLDFDDATRSMLV